MQGKRVCGFVGMGGEREKLKAEMLKTGKESVWVWGCVGV
jgi:hypothetical protein